MQYEKLKRFLIKLSMQSLHTCNVTTLMHQSFHYIVDPIWIILVTPQYLHQYEVNMDHNHLDNWKKCICIINDACVFFTYYFFK